MKKICFAIVFILFLLYLALTFYYVGITVAVSRSMPEGAESVAFIESLPLVGDQLNTSFESSVIIDVILSVSVFILFVISYIKTNPNSLWSEEIYFSYFIWFYCIALLIVSLRPFFWTHVIGFIICVTAVVGIRTKPSTQELPIPLDDTQEE